MRSLRAQALLAAVLVLGLTSCDSGSDATNEPIVPPSFTAFDLNVDDFAGASGRAANEALGADPFEAVRIAPDGPAERSAASGYYESAKFAVSFMRITYQVLTLPVLGLKTARAGQPVEGRDGTFTWSRDTTVYGQGYSFELAARPDGGQVEWTLSQTRGPNTSGQIFAATTTRDGTSGTWERLVPGPAPAPGQGATITGTFEEPDSTSNDLTILAVAEDGRRQSVHYNRTGNVRLMERRDLPIDIRQRVEWMGRIGPGSVFLSHYLFSTTPIPPPDNVFHCWNERGENADCPPATPQARR